VFDASQSLDPDDRMRLIARLWESLPDDYWAAPDSRERARIDSMLIRGDTEGLAELPRRIARKLLSPPSSPRLEKIYSAPRRFDLATIFVVTFAYSLLFGVMGYVTNYLDFPRSFSLFVGAFITLVGIGQAMLYGGQNARVASLLVGAVLCVLLNLIGVVWPPRHASGIGLFFVLPFSAAFGAGFGYMAGALVGGVFLVADKLRTNFATRTQDSVDEHIELVEIDTDQESHAIT
jgi:hypothetical protein